MRLMYAKYSADGALNERGLLNITNEACIHRGTYPHLTTISCYLNDHLLTTSVGDGSIVKLQVHRQSRGRATAYIDGRDCGELLQGECIEIKKSPYPLMCVNRDDLAAGWALDINQLLKFNRTFSYPHEAPFGDHDPDSE
ncbi:NADH kinase pos5 [Coemansia sp. RSA 2702]|nr:NADH kinase pos5 [Coemansia sp. RSA 2702]